MVELEDVRRAVEPVVARLGLELVDIEVVGSGKARTLRVTIDRDGGVDLDGITDVTRVVSPELDQLDPFDGRYTLEVSSPGLERPLRQPAAFRRFVGTKISVKTHEAVGATGADGPTGDVHSRRLHGVLESADDDGIELRLDGIDIDTDTDEVVRLPYDAISGARTVFEWGPAPKPGGPRPAGRTPKKGEAAKQMRQQ